MEYKSLLPETPFCENVSTIFIYILSSVDIVQYIPDISRTGSTQKKCRSLIGSVKLGETHDVIKVC